MPQDRHLSSDMPESGRARYLHTSMSLDANSARVHQQVPHEKTTNSELYDKSA